MTAEVAAATTAVITTTMTTTSNTIYSTSTNRWAPCGLLINTLWSSFHYFYKLSYEVVSSYFKGEEIRADKLFV